MFPKGIGKAQFNPISFHAALSNPRSSASAIAMPGADQTVSRTISVLILNPFHELEWMKKPRRRWFGSTFSDSPARDELLVNGHKAIRVGSGVGSAKRLQRMWVVGARIGVVALLGATSRGRTASCTRPQAACEAQDSCGFAHGRIGPLDLPYANSHDAPEAALADVASRESGLDCRNG